MLMANVRGALTWAALTTLVALGLGEGSRARAEEPPAPVVVPVPIPGVEERPALPGRFQTRNFKVEAPTHAIAEQVAAEAERQRHRRAKEWLGKELPDWPQPCPIRVTITARGNAGATTFAFDNGKIIDMTMLVEGPLEMILTNCLPHEVTHTILAHHVRRPVPRWVDEGAAILSESDAEQQRHHALTRQLLNTPGRVMPLSRLLKLTGYPPDVMVLYAQGFSLTHFLVKRKDRKALVAFVEKAEHGDWDKAVKAVYGFDSVEELEKAWLASLRTQPEVPARRS